MQFTYEQVQAYVSVVCDINPIHDTIVPGQMVVETCLAQIAQPYRQLNVRYKRPIFIDECLLLRYKSDGIYNVINRDNEIKIQLQLIS